MPYFLCKLILPRPTFAEDMTEAERRLMGEHVAYWKSLADRGIAIVFSPVSDPEGGWGVGIVEVESDTDTGPLEANDPTIKSGLGFKYEVYPMPRAILRK